jgi:MoxR-like ATPase
MTVEYFSSQPRSDRSAPVVLPTSHQMHATKPESYIADPGLVDAVNTALLLNQPLLLTGEPGTGKTQLAFALAHQLGYPSWRFQAKSTSQARDLFYVYDAVAHFRAEKGTRLLDFVRFQALGSALLAARPWAEVMDLYQPGSPPREPVASVVLIDEVDKAPRDFPNDILAELEDLRFAAPEIGVHLTPPGALRPVVVITSNSERDLPDAFLRRCVYYDIPFPAPDALRAILAARLKRDDGLAEPESFCSHALGLFAELRSLTSLRKKPATAELLAWMTALRRAYPKEENPLVASNAALSRLGVLIKGREDLELATAAVKAYKPKKA